MIEVSCHCGGVTLSLPRAPSEIVHCDCSICRKSGFQGAYYGAGEVPISGELDGYVRSDMEKPCMTMWRCRTCGILTHWTLLDDWPYDDVPKPDRMGVNARLLDVDVADGLPIRQVEGAGN